MEANADVEEDGVDVRASARALDDGLDNISFLLKLAPHVLAGHVRGLVDFVG